MNFRPPCPASEMNRNYIWNSLLGTISSFTRDTFGLIAETFILVLLEEYYKSPLGGHMGLSKTLSRLQQSFF